MSVRYVCEGDPYSPDSSHGDFLNDCLSLTLDVFTEVRSGSQSSAVIQFVQLPQPTVTLQLRGTTLRPRSQPDHPLRSSDRGASSPRQFHLSWLIIQYYHRPVCHILLIFAGLSLGLDIAIREIARAWPCSRNHSLLYSVAAWLFWRTRRFAQRIDEILDLI